MWPAFGLWLCSKGYHSVEATKIFCGGEGPDESAGAIRCRRCRRKGFLYCDGTKDWTGYEEAPTTPTSLGPYR